MSDDRLNQLGKDIWTHVMRIEAYHVAKGARMSGWQAVATKNVHAEMKRLIEAEEAELWGDLQTLFRGGVFPEDLADMWEEMNDNGTADPVRSSAEADRA